MSSARQAEIEMKARAALEDGGGWEMENHVVETWNQRHKLVDKYECKRTDMLDILIRIPFSSTQDSIEQISNKIP